METGEILCALTKQDKLAVSDLLGAKKAESENFGVKSIYVDKNNNIICGIIDNQLVLNAQTIVYDSLENINLLE